MVIREVFNMIEMKVMGIALDVRTNSPIVVLHDLENRKALPIWIGSAEASAIIRCIEGLVVARPMTHDLVTNIIEKIGYKLDKIEINDVEKETYYATLFLSKGDETLEIDARPSDAIAVAMRAEAPIFVAPAVLLSGSVYTDSAKAEEESQEFKDFIQNIKPSDFEKLMKGKHEESDQ
jgi:bifunctional DNase/RNase